METWGFLDSGANHAAVNMAMDEALMNWHREGLIPPTIRFYLWENPTLSIGHFQKLNGIHMEAVHDHQVEMVRRMTGGSAVLHADELTYSIVITEKHASIPRSVSEAYYILSKGVVAGYANLGIAVDYAVPETEERKTKTAVCFEKSALYEMVVAGKKLSGNAQTRKNGVLLQHGSIPMRIDIDLLFDLFRFPSEVKKQERKRQFFHKATTIDELTGKRHTYADLHAAFHDGFQHGLGISLHPITLSDAQWDEVYKLAQEKYTTISDTRNRSISMKG